MHLSVKPIQRSKGKTSVAAAAYRAGEKLLDERTGLTHDYTKKQGVEHTQIFAPENAPQWANDRALLWNEVERKENRGNSTLAFEMEVGFPAEFDKGLRQELGDVIAHEIVERYNAIVDMAYHEPGKEGDERNHHAHIMFTSRGLDDTTKDGWAKGKYRDLAADVMKDADGNNTTRGKEEIKSLREFVAKAMNDMAERDGLAVTIEHESFASRGIEKEPEIHVGFAANDMQKKEGYSERYERNEAIRERNRISEQEALEGFHNRDAFYEKFKHGVQWVNEQERTLSHWDKIERDGVEIAQDLRHKQQHHEAEHKEQEKGREL